MTMTGYRWSTVTFLFAAVGFSGCGGGGGGADSHARCSDFRYQEDAQAALAAGATQLDGDHDGVACESLPHRPTSSPTPSPAPTPAPVPTPPPAAPVAINFMSVKGDQGTLLGTTASAQFDVYAHDGGITGMLQRSDQASSATTQTYLGDGMTFRTTTVADELMVAMTDTPGLAVPAVATNLSDVAGDYTLLGQQCSWSSGCKAAYASGRMTATGGWHICIGQPYSSNCTGGIDLQASTPQDEPSNVGTWTLGDQRARMVGWPKRSLVELAFQDLYASSATGSINTTRTTLFGFKTAAAATTAVPSTSSYSWYDEGYYIKTGVPPEVARTGSASATPGLFMSAGGDLYLRSTTGILVSWNGSASRLGVAVLSP